MEGKIVSGFILMALGGIFLLLENLMAGGFGSFDRVIAYLRTSLFVAGVAFILAGLF